MAGPGAKSSSSKNGRSSTSPSSNGTRLAHSMASSLDFTWMIQNPATSSLVSANGPSTTVRLLPEYLMRAPFELGLRPGPVEHDPGFHQFFVVLRHVGEHLLARHHARFRFLAGLHNHHEPHVRLSLLSNEQVICPSIYTSNGGRRIDKWPIEQDIGHDCSPRSTAPTSSSAISTGFAGRSCPTSRWGPSPACSGRSCRCSRKGPRTSAWRPITSSSRSATISGPATRPARGSIRRCGRSSTRSRRRSWRWA